MSIIIGRIDMKQTLGFGNVVWLLGVNLLYALVSLLAAMVARLPMFSLMFLLGVGGVFLLFGLYAIVWQQLLKRLPLSLAYMFKGTSLLFVLLLSALFLGDAITWQNLVGAVLIIVGIVLFARADE